MRALIVTLSLCTAACARTGLIDDGGSLSFGQGNHGLLTHGERLPAQGDGFRIPKRWADRGLNFGTDELVRLIVDVGRQLRAGERGLQLSVGDLSWVAGGPSQWHRSHQTGRDVDLLFFITDEKGRLLPTHDSMPHFDAELRAAAEGESAKRLRWDTVRNWRLVRAVLLNPSAHVQFIFVFDPLRLALLQYAESIGEPQWLIAWAADVLRQPLAAAPHDDHFHVRIQCAARDIAAGCIDTGRELAHSRFRGFDHSYTREVLLRGLASAVQVLPGHRLVRGFSAVHAR